MSSRLPRFKRAKEIAPIQLTERDREIIRTVHRHRFLRSPQIVALIGGNTQPILRRLQLLYHHGYLERPRAQIEYYHKGGSRCIAYGLGNKGAVLLKAEGTSSFQKIRWSEKNRTVGRMFLEHALFVSDVMVAFALACRKTGIRLLTEDKLFGNQGSVSWKVSIQGRKLGVVPDRVFGLEFPDGDRAFYFLEADRGTMPVVRKNLSQTSIYRKLLAYEATWTQSIHRTRFGFHRFRVLTVTLSAARVKSLTDACALLKQGHGLFLFADQSVLEKPDDVFSSVWQTCKQDETGSLSTRIAGVF